MGATRKSLMLKRVEEGRGCLKGFPTGLGQLDTMTGCLQDDLVENSSDPGERIIRETDDSTRAQD